MPSPTNTTNPIAGTSASTLTDLMGHHDLQFIACAYKTVLGRHPDPEGLAYYVGRLRAGIPKIRILADLRLSREGRGRKLTLNGLDEAVRHYRMGQWPFVGRLLRMIQGTEGGGPVERKLRTLENQLLVLADDTQRRLAQIEKRLTDLHNLTEPIAQIVLRAIDGTNDPTPPVAAPTAAMLQTSPKAVTPMRRSQDASQLPPQESSIHTMIEKQVKLWTK